MVYNTFMKRVLGFVAVVCVLMVGVVVLGGCASTLPAPGEFWWHDMPQNVRIVDGTVQWDAVETAAPYGYKISMYRVDGENRVHLHTHHGSSTEFGFSVANAHRHIGLDSSGVIPTLNNLPVTVEFRVGVHHITGDIHSMPSPWSKAVTFEFTRQLSPVTNLRVAGDYLMWDATTCDDLRDFGIFAWNDRTFHAVNSWADADTRSFRISDLNVEPFEYVYDGATHVFTPTRIEVIAMSNNPSVLISPSVFVEFDFAQ